MPHSTLHSATITHSGGSRVLQGIRVRDAGFDVDIDARVKRKTGKWVFRGDEGMRPRPFVLEHDIQESTPTDSGALALSIVGEAQDASQVETPRGTFDVTGLRRYEMSFDRQLLTLRLVFVPDELPHSPENDITDIMQLAERAGDEATVSLSQGEQLGVMLRTTATIQLRNPRIYGGWFAFASGTSATVRVRIWDMRSGALLYTAVSTANEGDSESFPFPGDIDDPIYVPSDVVLGVTMACTDDDMTVHVFDPGTGRFETTDLRTNMQAGHIYIPRGLVYEQTGYLFRSNDDFPSETSFNYIPPVGLPIQVL